MPRHSEYTPEEDRIILDAAGEHADVTNARLTEAGFKPRTPRQLTNRRQHLRKTVDFTAENTPFKEVTPEALAARLKRLQMQRARAAKFIEDTDAEMVEIANAMREQADTILATMSGS